MSQPCKLGLVVFNLSLVLTLGGCPLLGIEGDEIDIADEGTDSGEDDTDTNNDSGTEGSSDDIGTEGSSDGGSEDTSGIDCALLVDAVLDLGETEVLLGEADSSLAGSCGGDGPELIFEFTAPASGSYEFELTQTEFKPVLYVLQACVPIDELDCVAGPGDLTLDLTLDQTVYVVVDSDLGVGVGPALLSVTAL